MKYKDTLMSSIELLYYYYYVQRLYNKLLNNFIKLTIKYLNTI